MKPLKWIDKNFDFNSPLVLPGIALYVVTFLFLYFVVGLGFWGAWLLAMVTQFALTPYQRKRDD